MSFYGQPTPFVLIRLVGIPSSEMNMTRAFLSLMCIVSQLRIPYVSIGRKNLITMTIEAECQGNIVKLFLWFSGKVHCSFDTEFSV
jgi:hypothetical protein